MFCNQCGKRIYGAGRYCDHCGALVVDGFASSDSFSERSEEIGDFMTPNILMSLFCCLAPSSLVALGFSLAARSSKRRGAWESALVRATVAKTLFWASLGAALITAVLAFCHMADPEFSGTIHEEVDANPYWKLDESESPTVPTLNDGSETAIE